jgi:ubiquinone/menaquinone biosynthesis C-methylase UbiE
MDAVGLPTRRSPLPSVRSVGDGVPVTSARADIAGRSETDLIRLVCPERHSACENASIRFFGLSANFPGLSVKRFASASRSSKSWRRSSMAVGAKALHNCSCEEDASQLTEGESRKGAFMNPNKALWEKGDFTKIAAFMRQSGEAVIQAIGITPPLRVMDLGCGDGTTAIPLARLGAEVVGIDIARNLVEAGNRRAAEAGFTRLRFQEGDACNLEGIADRSFDLVVSIFGAMFAPKPFDVAKEMVRVTKPGGRIVMGNWIPNDPTFVSQVLKISLAFTPPPEGFVSPMTWGVESNIIERFRHAGVPKENISMVHDTYYFASPEKSPAQFIDLFEKFYGPTMNAVEAAQKNGKAEDLHKQLLELANAQNKSKNAGTFIPATFMRITVSV